MEDIDYKTRLEKEERQEFFLLIVLLSLLAILVASVFLFPNTEKKELEEKNSREIVKAGIVENLFASISLSAKAVYVLDVGTGEVLYAHNEEAQLPLASITKLMTVIVAAEQLPSQSVITIGARDLYAEGDSGLLLGERWALQDILGFTLMVSSNDGAQALANASSALQKKVDKDSDLFTQLMNEKVGEIGLPQTYFLNSTGLDTNETIGGGYGSARDVVYMLRYALSDNAIPLGVTRDPSREYRALNNGGIHIARNTNQTVGNIPGLIASKTGFTDLAGGNLVIAFDASINRPIIIAVLGSSLEGRFTDVEQLVEASLSALSL